MKTFVSILSLTLLASLGAEPSRAQAPSNDEYAGAVEIGGLTYSDTMDISQATGAASDPFLEGAYPTVWYRFTPSEDVIVDLDTSESIGVNGVAVFTEPPSTDTLVAAPANDPSFLQVSLTGGTTYAIMVFAVEAPDTLVLKASVGVAGPPANDEYEGAAFFSGLPHTITQDISLATGNASDPFVQGQHATVWYVFNAPQDGVYDFDTSKSSGRVATYVFTNPPSEGAFIAASTPENPSLLETPLVGGWTYVVMAVALDPPGQLVLDFSLAGAAPPANDEYSGAKTIAALPFAETRNISQATGVASDPFLEGAYPTVWYRITPSEDVIVDLDTSESIGTNAIAVFTDPPSTDTFVAASSNDPSFLQVSLTGGTTYAIMVVAVDTADTLVLKASVGVAGPPANDEYEGAAFFSGLPHTITQDISLATGNASDPFVQGQHATVWYVFNSPQDGVYHFDTSKSSGRVATYVFTNPPSEGAFIAASTPENPSLLETPLVGGWTYVIMAVALDPPGQLVLDFSLADAAPPANDEYEGAAFLIGLPHTITQDISLATGNASDPFVQGQHATVWYVFNAPRDGVYYFDTSKSSGRVATYVFTNPPSEGAFIAASTPESPSLLETPLVGGWTYVVMAVALDPPGQLVLEVEAPGVNPELPNDDYGGAIEIERLSFTDVRDISLATGAESDPYEWSYPSVWYRFTPDEDMTVRFDVSASSVPMAVLVFADPPSEGSLVAGSIETRPSRLYADLVAGTTYAIMVIATDTPGTLVLNVSDRTVRGEPNDVYVSPEDASRLAEIIAGEDPQRPLRIICGPGDYLLEQPLAIERTHITFVAEDPSAHPRFLGPSKEDATLFTANGEREIAFVQIDMEDALTGIAFEGVHGLDVDDCTISTYGPAILFQRGKDASVANSRLLSEMVAAVIVETRGIEVVGNIVEAGGADTLLLSPDLSDVTGAAGLILVGIDSSFAPTRDFEPGTMTVTDNRILCLGVVSLGILTVTGGGSVFVEDNHIIASVGIVAPVLNLGRVFGLETQAVIARNTILGLAVGIVGISVLGHLDIAENSIVVLGQPLSLQQEGLEASSAGIVAVGAFGTADATDNDVTFLNNSAALAPSFGIWQVSVSNEDMVGAAPIDESGLAHIAGNRIIGAGVGIRADNAFEAAAEIVGNDIWLGLFGQVGISSFRAGGRDLTAAHTATAAGDYTPSQTTIASNAIHALEPTRLLGQPIGIEAYSVTTGPDAEPLVVEDNQLFGAYVTAINAYGTPAVVRGNGISGTFTEGINTLDFPGGALPDDEAGIGTLLGPAGSVATSFWDEFPAASSSVRDNTLQLVIPRLNVTPILTEPGADVQGNTFGYGLPRPWSP